MIADNQEHKKEKNSKLIEQQGQQQQHEDLNSNISSTLTAEERQKASSRREKDLERKKRLRIKQKAEIQAYEESLVLARKIETDDKIDEPTHVLQQSTKSSIQQIIVKGRNKRPSRVTQFKVDSRRREKKRSAPRKSPRAE